jgi:hypothetical protein
MPKQINFRASDEIVKLLRSLVRRVQAVNPGKKIAQADVIRMGLVELDEKMKSK